jgi:hypothetical protein
MLSKKSAARTATLSLLLLIMTLWVGCSDSGQESGYAVPSFCPTNYASDLPAPLTLTNTAPRAYYQRVSTTVGTDLDITLLACDPDDPTTAAGMLWSVTTPPFLGSLSAGSGTYSSQPYQVTYIPAQAGTDTFYYQVMDAEGATSDVVQIQVSVATPGTGSPIDPAKVSGTWFGPARIDGATDLDVPIPGIVDHQAPVFTTATVSINGAGVVTSINIGGANFSSLGNSWQADFGALDGDQLAHLDFPNTPLVNVGSTGIVPVIDGGGLLFDQPVTSGAGASPQYAFLFIHDKYGWDVTIATLQRGATGPLPSYFNSDLDNTATGLSTTWSGFTAEFVDQTTNPDGVNLDLRFQGYPSWDLLFDDSQSVDVFVSGGSIMDSGTLLAIIGGTVFQSGSGYFSGTMTDQSDRNWNLDFLMSPDKQFIAGFADDPGQSLPWRWHDIALTRQ